MGTDFRVIYLHLINLLFSLSAGEFLSAWLHGETGMSPPGVW